MADPMACPHCRDDAKTPCSFCGWLPRGGFPIPAGPRLAPLMDALPAEDDRLTAQPTPLREAPTMRPKLHVEEIESPEVRGRSKGSRAFEIGMGLLCVLGGVAWFVGGLALGVFFRYPVVLLIGGVGLVVDGLRRNVR
jgi:hypothetical protein